MMSQIRSEVLKVFKQLHRTRQNVFKDDDHALNAARMKINESFRQNRDVTNQDEIQKMLQLAKSVEEELRRNVIQARQTEENVFELRITPDTTRLDNVLFNPEAVIEKPSKKVCCGDKSGKDLDSKPKQM